MVLGKERFVMTIFCALGCLNSLLEVLWFHLYNKQFLLAGNGGNVCKNLVHTLLFQQEMICNVFFFGCFFLLQYRLHAFNIGNAALATLSCDESNSWFANNCFLIMNRMVYFEFAFHVQY